MKALPYPLFYTRDFTKTPMPNTRLKHKTARLLWNVMGWCDQADVDVYGPEDDLWSLLDGLRRPVEFWDGLGLCWWGYVHEIVLHLKQHDLSFSLETMANTIAVSYNYVGAGTDSSGVQRQTTWATDANSVATYGTKELIVEADTLSDAAAVALRTAKLAEYGKPAGCPEPAKNDQVHATIYCKGWWQTLGWRYCSEPLTASVSYTTIAAGQENAVGNAPANNKVAQSFTVGASNINAMGVKLYAKKYGNPTDELRIALYEVDANGLPTGDELCVATLLPAYLSTTIGWVTLTFDETELTAGTKYSLVVDKCAGNHATNYYSVGVNTAKGYAGGNFKIWNMSTWNDRSTDADMLFSIDINGQAAIDDQMDDIIDDYGQFFTVLAVGGSTEVQGSYQPGDTASIQVVEDMMAIGGANNRRYIVKVDELRRVTIGEEGVQPTTSLWNVTNRGVMYCGRPMELHECPDLLGHYIHAETTPFVTGDSYTTIGLRYVESIEWTPDGGIQLRYKGRPAPEEVQL